jgi:ferredoxin
MFEEYDLLGIGGPVFAWKPAKLLRSFIKALPNLPEKYIFSFCTCAGDDGNFHVNVEKMLKEKQISAVFATETFYYPSSYTCWRKSEGNEDIIKQQEIDKATTFGSTLVSEFEAVSTGSKSPPKLKKALKAWIIGTFSSDWALRIFLGTIKLDQEKCTKCGACAKVCPENAITLDPYPSISKKLCSGCCGCINVCPVRALDSKRTRGNEQYQFNESLIEN